MEKQINAKLAATTAENRPETSTRRRIQSVAVCGNGYEATDGDGGFEHISFDQAKKLLG